MFPERFRFDEHGNIVGHGFFFSKDDQLRPGLVLLSIDLLNQLYDLAVKDGRIGQSDAEREARRAQDRIRAAKEDLVEDLGLDPALLSKP